MATSKKTPKKQEKKWPIPRFHVLAAVGLAVFLGGLGLYIVLSSRAATTGSTTLKDDGSVCIAPTTFPNAPNGGMQYLNYQNQSLSDINRVKVTFKVDTSMTAQDATFYQFYDAKLGKSGQYFGIQTDAPSNPSSQMLIFSKFIDSTENRLANNAEIRAATGSTAVLSTNEGTYVSLRRVLTIPTQAWQTVEVKRAEAATLSLSGQPRNGDWYDYYYNGTKIGGIWFERTSPTSTTPAAWESGGGTWSEFWLNNGTQLVPVPKQQLSLKPLLFNDTYGYTGVTSSYSAMPNSDTSYVPASTPYSGDLVLRLGGDTPRCHPNGQVINVTTQALASSTVVTPPTPVDTTPPDGPATLTASVVNSSQINLSWSVAKDAGTVKYLLYRNGVLIYSGTNLSYMNVNLGASTSYTYQVKAQDSAGNISTGTTASASTPANPAAKYTPASSPAAKQ